MLLNKIRKYEDELFELTGLKITLRLSFEMADYTLEEFFRMIGRRLYVPYTELVATGRKGHIVEARQIAIFLAYKYLPGVSKSEIGRFLNVDHTTIIHAIRKIKDMSEIGDAVIIDKLKDSENYILSIIQNKINESNVYQA